MKVKRDNQKKTTKSIRNLFKIKNENKAIQYRTIRDIRTLFEQQEENDFYKRIRAGIKIGIKILENIKVVVIEIKTYQ